MRVLVVLAFFCVCNADIALQPHTNLDVVKDAFWDYIAKATQAAEESLKQMKESDMGQEVNTKLSESVEAVTQYVTTLKAQVTPVSEDFLTQLNAEVQKLKDSLNTYPDELKLKLQAKVEELTTEARPYTESIDPEAVKALVQQKSMEIKEQLDQGLANLKSQMVPLSEQARTQVEQGVEEFGKSLEALSKSYETQVTQKSQELQQSVAAGAEELKAKLDASAEDVKAKVALLWESFSKISSPPAQ